MSTEKDEELSVEEAERQEGAAELAKGPSSGEERAQDSVSVGPEEYQALQEKAKERDLFLDKLQRTQADLDNFQKRFRRERPQLELQGARSVLVGLLSVVDNFERALATLDDSSGAGDEKASSLEEGFRMIHQQFLQLLDQQGVSEIPAQGEPFNPELHEAMAQEQVDDRPSGEIVTVLQKGYLHNDSVLRPSKVRVALNVADCPKVPDTSEDDEGSSGERDGESGEG